ncbi:MAG: histone deacetylase [Acidobacteriota bacterium]
MNYGIVLDTGFTRHLTPPGHPERPERVAALLEAFERWNRLDELVRVPTSTAQEGWIQAVHSSAHLARIKATSGKESSQLDGDTATSADSYQVALLAAGSGVTLVDALVRERIDSGFALIRPPGHHAESNRPMGFCLFNNVAVAAEQAIQKGLAEKVAIVDFDVHHGNGTQEIFYSRSDVLYLSTHQFPFYPGTGHFSETGAGPGQGFTANFPLPAGSGDSFYCTIFQDFLLPIIQQFSPQLILVSAGYDAHRDDPLAGMNLSTDGFGELVNLLNKVAREVCGGRILYLLEGGYNLSALCDAVLLTIDTSLTPRKFDIPTAGAEDYEIYRDVLKSKLTPYWEL